MRATERIPSSTGLPHVARISALLLVTLFAVTSTAASAVCTDYEATPPFLAQKLKPNVLLILDNSGSMNEFASHEVQGCRDGGTLAYTGYDEGKKYYGLFDPDRTYVYDNSTGRHYFREVGDTIDDPATPAVYERSTGFAPAVKQFSGNWLNWWTMRRLDVAKKVLTGGKVAPDTDEVVLEGGPTDSRDIRRIYNDCISTDAGCIATKNVYYTPFHRGIYSYFFNIDRNAHLGGSPDQFAIMFNVVDADFDVATDMTGATCADVPYNDLTQAFTNGDNNGETGYSYNGYVVAVKIEATDEPVTGIIQNLENDVRFGYMQFNYGTGPGEGVTHDADAGNWDIDGDGTIDVDWRYADGGRVRNFVGDIATTTDPHGDTALQIVHNINQQNIQMNTPLEEVLWEAGRYFQQQSPAFLPETTPDTPPSNTEDFEISNDWDPYYYNDFDNGDLTYGRFVPCAKSFIILVSDGSGNNNSGLPTADWPAGANTNTLTGDGSGYLDDIAYNLHVNDLRDDTTDFGKSSDTIKQNITLYTVFTFDDSASAKANMMKAARAGGFVDLNNDNNTGGTVSDTDPTAFVGNSEWDTDGDNVPDTYFEAQDGQEMEDRLESALTTILKRTSSGSAISVLSEKATEGAVIHQALFFPEKTFNTDYKVTWTGQINAYWFYLGTGAQTIREDNTNNTYLDILTDYALDFRIDTSGNLNIDYYDLDSVGAKNSLLGTYTSIDDVSRIWEAGEKLKARIATSRTIYGVDEADTMSTFLSANYTDFDDLFGSFTTFPTCLGTNDTDRAKNLINYTRGETDDFSSNTGSACRNRVVDSSGSIWKLGDIIHSTPKIIDYTPYSVLYTGSNDGMLHAFELGKVRKDGITSEQSVRLCDKNTGTCTTNDIGEELWSFIPKNTMPYLKYLADPDYCHIYTVDLGVYHINDGDQQIIIGGMRFGGATAATYEQGSSTYWSGDTDAKDGDIETDSNGELEQILPETDASCTPTTPENCLGLSSYFAIDVTDPENPVFLWEYTHPNLGFTYSGPAWINRGSKKYVMFGSGPTNYKGYATNQNLKLFILEVDSNFKLVDPDGDNDFEEHVHKIDGDGLNGFIKEAELSKLNHSFVGRMFTDGLDANNDGITDAVFFPINWNPSSAPAGWKGNVVMVTPSNDPPTDLSSTINWNIQKVFNQGQAPITTKIEHGNCFGGTSLYFGTGRWFYKTDEPGTTATSDVNSLYAIDISDCLTEMLDGDAGTNCKLNTIHSNHIDECPTANPGNHSWQYDGLEPFDGVYMKERVVSDPTLSEDYNIVFFTTAQPSSDVCDFGGRSRVFAMNCASGNNIFTAPCPGYEIKIPDASYLLQLSGGNIEATHLDNSNLSQESNKASDWFTGLPPEAGGSLVPPGGLLNGEIILWIER